MSVTLDEVNEKVSQIAGKLEELIKAIQQESAAAPTPIMVPPHLPTHLRFDRLRREGGGGRMGNEAAEIRRQRKAAALAAAQKAQQDVHADFDYARTQLGDAIFLQVAQTTGA